LKLPNEIKSLPLKPPLSKELQNVSRFCMKLTQLPKSLDGSSN
jgi:hypothetical protein